MSLLDSSLLIMSEEDPPPKSLVAVRKPVLHPAVIIIIHVPTTLKSVDSNYNKNVGQGK